MGQVTDLGGMPKSQSDLWQNFELDWRPGFDEVLQAAFNLDNTFGATSGISRFTGTNDEPVIDYDPLLDPAVPTEFLNDVAYSRSPSETRSLLRQANERKRDRLILEQSSTGDLIAAELIAGAADPVNLLFGGSAALGRTALRSFAAGARVGGKAGLQAGVVTEGIFQAYQPERSIEESVANIVFSGGLSAGALGFISVGRHGRALSRKQFDDLAEAINADLRGEPKVYSGTPNDYRQAGFAERPGERRFAPGVGGGDVGAPPPRQAPPETGDVPTWTYLDSAQEFMFPGPRTRNSPLRSSSEISEKLVESNTLKKKNLAGVDTPQAVETLAKQHLGAMSELLGAVSDRFRRYKARVTGTDEPVFVSSVRDRFSEITGRPKGSMSVAEFRREVTKTLRSGRQSQVPEVNEAAGMVREMFDDYANLAEQYGLLEPGSAIPNYVPRMWNQSEVFSRRTELVNLVMRDQHSRGMTPDRAKIEAQVDAIIQSGRPIEGMTEAGPRGVFQSRELDITEELYDDFLINDIDDIVRSYVRVASVDVELARKFGRVDMRDQILEVHKEANALVRQAGENAELVAQIRQKASEDIKALEAMRDILRGIYGLPENPYGIGSRAARLAMDLNNIIMLGGATVASLTDAGRVIMASGLKDTFRAMKLGITNFQTAKAAAHEVKLAGTGLDMALQTTAMRLTGMQDLPPRFTKAEAAMGYLTNGFFIANLLSPWNAFMKQFTGITVSHRMLKDSISWSKGTLSAKGQQRMLSAGLNSRDARRIREMFDLHGEEIDGVMLPNTQLWDNPDLVRKFRAALARDVDAAIVTPGAGDQPLWVHNTVGRLIGQYKSFAFAAANKVMVPGIQYKDANQLFGAIMMVWMGGHVVGLRQQMQGRDDDRDLGEFVLDGIDQSGLLGWYFQANNMLEAMSDGRAGVRPMLGLEDNYYSPTYRAGQLSPTITTASRATAVLGDLLSGNVTHKTRRDAQNLIPGKSLFYLHLGELMRTNKNLQMVSETE